MLLMFSLFFSKNLWNKIKLKVIKGVFYVSASSFGNKHNGNLLNTQIIEIWIIEKYNKLKHKFSQIIISQKNVRQFENFDAIVRVSYRLRQNLKVLGSSPVNTTDVH